MEQQQGEALKRGLKNRHIQLIALGGAVGTGLFLGSASVIESAGPAVILGYAIAGFIAFLIMRQLGEMVVEEPVAGSFSHFAYKYWATLQASLRAGTTGCSMCWSPWRNSPPLANMSSSGGQTFRPGLRLPSSS